MFKLVRERQSDPEMYDVFAEDGSQVGYFLVSGNEFAARMRVGNCPLVYSCEVQGDGYLQSDERDQVLRKGLGELQSALGVHSRTDYIIEERS